MITKGEFNYFLDGESKTIDEIRKLANIEMTVSIKGLEVHYFSPKKKVKMQEEVDIENFVESNKIQEILKEAKEYQKQKGGILKGVEFPFDGVLTFDDKIKNSTFINLKNKSTLENKVIEDWNRKEELPPYKEAPLDEILKDWCNQLIGIYQPIASKYIIESENKEFLDKTVGKKETEGKLDYELDWEFIQQMAERMGQNKGKYEPYNWKKLMDVEKLKQSLFRHIIEIMKGNYSDDGRKYGHLESLADNAMMINYQLKNNQKEIW